MTISERQIISIAEIALYIPAILCAIFLIFRHGFHRSGGWIYISIFSILRIATGALQLLTVKNPTSKTLFIAYVIVLNVGLSPLLASTAGLIRRVVRDLKSAPVGPRTLRILQVVILGGLIAGVVGGIRSGNDWAKDGEFKTETLTKVSIILFVASFIVICIVTLLSIGAVSASSSLDKRIYYSVFISIPLLAVRLLYSILATFTSGSKFNPLSGNVWIYLFMAIIEEFAVVLIYLVAGLTTPVGKKMNGPDYIDISPSTHYSPYGAPPRYQGKPVGY